VIIDLSEPTTETYRLSQQIRDTPTWSRVPLLFISFSGDDLIRKLQHSHVQPDGRVHYYAHTVLGLDGLLAQVQACLSPGILGTPS
jgi:hypothetical protein